MPSYLANLQKMNSRLKSHLTVCFYCCLPLLVLGVIPAAFGEGMGQAHTQTQAHKLILPKSYQIHLPALQQATQLVLQMPRCQELVQGSLHIDRSTLRHPVFRIMCRDREANSFALLVDGISLHLLDDTRPGGSISFSDLQHE